MIATLPVFLRTLHQYQRQGRCFLWEWSLEREGCLWWPFKSYRVDDIHVVL